MAKITRGGTRVTGILAAVLGLFLIYGAGTNAMGNYRVDKLTEHMKTACVGRFLIDVPAGMDYSYSHTFMAGFWVAALPESSEAFLQRVTGREEEINSQPNELGGKNMEKVDTVSTHGFTGKIFKFGRTSVRGVEDGRDIYYVNVALEGYVHADNITFTFKIEDIDPDQTNILSQMIEKLRVVPPNEIPKAPGFCFGRGMLVDPVPVEWTEGVVMFAGFKAHPDLALAFHTRAGLGKDPSDPGRLARDARADAELPLWYKAMQKKLRIGHRSINGIDGEEVLERGTERNFTNVYMFDWEVIGTKDNVLSPDMHLEMSTGHPAHAGAPPVTSFLGNDEALVQLWDKISSSIRVRPTKSAPSEDATPTPQGPTLGDSATAGDICPATGWWQCADGGEGTKVLGGQRQLLKKGQRMPQALLLPPQSAWEKLRGVQPSYENKQPTAWSLIDRRSKARVKTEVTLAPAISQPGTIALLGADNSGKPADIGRFVRSGAPCPASGWWQCQDPEALDGTRWFAAGDVLPIATFRVWEKKVLFAPRDDKVFHRRTTWQLVRKTTEPHDADAGA
jgi:hypothetical protein